jgi:hypothetical protein
MDRSPIGRQPFHVNYDAEQNGSGYYPFAPNEPLPPYRAPIVFL